jgi:small subunit ribosomal protein S3
MSFGSYNQKIILKVYSKIKKYRIISRTIYKRIRKKGSNRKMESYSSSKVITHIEIQKEIDTMHVVIHIGFPNLLKKKGG